MDFVVLVICAIPLIWLLNQWRVRKYEKLAYKLPTNKFHRFLGFGPIVRRKNLLKYIYQHGEKYGSNSIMWTGPVTIFLVFEPETLKDVLTSKNCIDKPRELYDGIAHAMGPGLISLDEPMWSHRRKVFNPAFSNKNLVSFLPLFNREINKMIKQIDAKNQPNQTDMLITFREFTLNIASQTTIKREFALTKYDINDYSQRLHGMLDFLAECSFNIAFNLKIVRTLAENTYFKEATIGAKMFKNFLYDSIQLTINEGKNDPSYVADINGAVDFALNGFNQNKLSWTELEDDLAHLFAGAFETTSTTLYMVIVLLAMFPEYQERAHEEVSTILQDEYHELTMEDIEHMVYLDMIINETMRVLPVVPQVFRVVTGENVTLSNGTVLPVGQIIGIDIYHLHRNKLIWGPDADKFNPDHFLPSNVNARHQYSFSPFTRGHRFCIGWRYAQISLKVTMSKLIKAYKFSTDFKFENLELENHVTSKLVEEPHVELKRR